MPRIRLAYDDSETEMDIASRIAAALEPSTFLKIRNTVFRVMGRGAFRKVEEPPSGGTLYEVVPTSPPPSTEAEGQGAQKVQAESLLTSPEPSPPPPPEAQPDISPALTLVTPSEPPPGPPPAVQVGQQWVPRDKRRRQTPFTVIRIEQDHFLTNDGRKIALNRLSRYRLV